MTDDDIFAVTDEQGGNWLPRTEWRTRAHSILFTDGHTWDEINGFRPKVMDYTPKSMAIVAANWGRPKSERLCEATGRPRSELSEPDAMITWLRNLFEPVDPWTDEERCRRAEFLETFRRPFKQVDDLGNVSYVDPEKAYRFRDPRQPKGWFR